MDTELLKKRMKIISDMPESELKFVAIDPEKACIDLELYGMCVERGDMTAWNKLKKIRKLFNPPKP